MTASAVAPGEATMSLRVIRNNGDVEHHEGEPVKVELPAELVAEYRALTKRMREIEAIFITCMTERA